MPVHEDQRGRGKEREGGRERGGTGACHSMKTEVDNPWCQSSAPSLCLLFVTVNARLPSQ